MKLKPRAKFAGREGPLLLIVMDGVGLRQDHPGNAVTRAFTPVLDDLLKSELSTQLITHGSAVGLASEGDMGNSEVGHNALGAGRVIAQGSSLIDKAIASGDIFKSEHWLAGPVMDLFNPMWLRINKLGCNWNRKTVEEVETAGYFIRSVEPFKIYTSASPAIFPVRIIKAEHSA